MKIRNTAKVLAVSAVVGMCLSSFGATTNGWWSENFDTVADIIALTNTTYSTEGVWTRGENDESAIETQFLKLDTQGTDLTWTPNALASSPAQVLVDADIYLVGSDTAPASTSFDGDELNPVQTAVFLRTDIDAEDNSISNTVLCAYVNDGGANAWVELDGVAMVDTNWYNIRIETTYGQGDPTVRFIVEDTVMFRKDSPSTEVFVIANFGSFSPPEAKKVNSVAFRGTGRVDNFVGQTVEAGVASHVNFSWATFTTEGQDWTANIIGSPPYTDVAGNPWTIMFAQTSMAGVTTNLTTVRVIKNGTVTNDYAASYDGSTWTLDPPLTYDSGNFAINLTITTAASDTDYIVEGYYGVEPTGGGVTPPADPTAPTIGGGLGAGVAPVAFETIGTDEYFVVQFAAPEAGVTYSLQTKAALSDANWADAIDPLATDTSANVDEVMTLKAPTGGASKMFFRVKAVIVP